MLPSAAILELQKKQSYLQPSPMPCAYHLKQCTKDEGNHSQPETTTTGTPSAVTQLPGLGLLGK